MSCLKRGRSIYLGETVLLCYRRRSFSAARFAGGERLAISVLLSLDSATGQLVEFEIQPTIIQVDYQLRAQQLQEILRPKEQVGAIPILPLSKWGVILPRTGNGFCGGERVCLGR